MTVAELIKRRMANGLHIADEHIAELVGDYDRAILERDAARAAHETHRKWALDYYGRLLESRPFDPRLRGRL